MKQILVALLAYSIFSTAQAATPLVISTLPSAPPHSWTQDGHFVGGSVEIVKRIFSEVNKDVTFITDRIIPFTRSLMGVENGSVDLIVPLYINKKRTDYADFSVPLYSSHQVVVVNKSNPLKFNNLKDLEGLRGATILGYTFGNSQSSDFIKQHPVTRVSSAKQLFEMLKRNRIDYFIYPLGPFRIELERTHYTDSFRSLPKPFFSAPLYLAISKKSPFAKQLPQVNQIIEKLKNDGTIDKILTEMEGKAIEFVTQQ